MREEDVPKEVETVQRWLGRCLLSIQRSEREIKTLLHEYQVELHLPLNCEDAEPQTFHAFSQQELKKMTMGQGIQLLLEKVLSSNNTPKAQNFTIADHDLVLSVRLNLGFENVKSLQDEFAEIVELRNTLVHHLLEKFELPKRENCEKACAYLKQSFCELERFRMRLVRLLDCSLNHRQFAVNKCLERLQVNQGRQVILAGTTLLSALLDVFSTSPKETLHNSPTHVLAHACRVRQHPGPCSNLILV